MGKYTSNGPTVEDAIQNGLKKLGLTKNEAEIKIVFEGKKGILGFGKKDAVVEISQLEKEEPTVEETKQHELESTIEEAKPENKVDLVDEGEERNDEAAFKFISDYLANISKEIGAPAKVNVEVVQDRAIFHMETQKPGLVIGKHGKVLNALQSLAQVLMHRQAKSKLTAIVNVGDYRERREAVLQQLADRTATKVLRTNQPVFLEPMPAFERKQIHFYLSKNDQVITHSEGNEPHRYLVVEPLKKRF
ncbi:RNA-binding cell elongation regulator Jag/EloR [Carnobacterium gallinarum]|uniref:RNA-binding cell elongation regulator Jag/EloR n=1 Tax=Carnobacterium gallinarum TaxID=2749 RepID=UPI00055920D4|nr:RNA-binding cell elongation regulator Jag/EloR [Carnobacterium gallinarum]